MTTRTSPLALYLAAAYTLLVIYASLHPFTGWRHNGVPLLAYLSAAWPRYFTGFDLSVNVLAYLPLGFLWVPGLQALRRTWLAVPLAVLGGAALSLAMEIAQNFLPSRVPSNVDLGCNVLGALIGAVLGTIWGKTLLSGGRFHTLRTRWITTDHIGDAGLLLFGLWLLTQLNPETLLFGSGDLRHLLGLESALSFNTERFQRVEAGVAAANTLAVGLLGAALLRRRPELPLLGFFLAALGIRAFATALQVAPEQAFRWLTPSNSAGLLAGLLLLPPLFRLGWPLQRVLAGSALLFSTILVNLAPENPYLSQAAQVWRPGHFLNFNGLTRLASVLWPFLALAWLLLPDHRPWKKSTI